jgi:multiple sugar transport system ATP-binding protein
MVFQNYALYPHMTVYKNMAFGLELRRVPGLLWRLIHPRQARQIRAEIAEKVNEVARVLDISHLLDRRPRQLSGGQRQRVAVGRAIVREPAAFLFDEPLSNLDAKLRVTTRAELKRLHQRLKTTTIYVTHDQEEAMTLGDRIVVMRDGKIQQADAPLRTYSQPRNRFVAGFIGMPPMNFFDGAIKIVDSRMVFEEGKLENARPADDGSAESGGELTLPGDGFRLPVPAHLRDRLAGMVGRHVVLGIRPEHLYLHPIGGEGDCCPLDVKLNVIEPLGNDMDVYAQTRLSDRVVGRLEAQSGLTAEAQVRLYADLRRVHFFEPGVTGMNLSLTTEPTHALA